MQFLLVALATLVVGASGERLRGPAAAQVQIVEELQSKLARVLRTENLLPVQLAGEARRVEADAARVVSLLTEGSRGGGRNASGNLTFDGVLAEYKAFAAHLARIEADLTRAAARAGEAASATTAAAPPQQESNEERAAELAAVLEGKVRHVLAHIRADRGLNATEASERDRLASSLEQALNTSSSNASSSVVERALRLHEALASARGFLTQRAETLGRQQAHIAAEVEAQEVHLLMSMLRQRRKLPMRAQWALLRRHQFANCSYARRLLAAHREDQPLYEQLLALLPDGARPTADGPSSAWRVDAAGSDGRVQIVSSQLKDNVKMMTRQLEAAREKLRQISEGSASGVTSAEQKEAKQILAGLDASLARVRKASGLGAELAALGEVQNQLAVWMKTFAGAR